MRRRDRTVGSIAALLLAACCVVALAFAVPASAQTAAFPQTDDQPEPDNTVTRIGLSADGSATWEITLRTRLENDSEVAEYERFQERFRSNTSRYLDPFADRMTGVVAAANDSADREMRATEFEAETSIQEVPRRWGVVSFRFTWTGFAAVDGDAVVVGDVFEGGFFIGDDDALAIAAPDGYAVADASPTPDELDGGVAEWRGREDFAGGRPSVRAVPGSTADGGNGGTGGGDGGGAVTGDALILVALGGILLVGGAALVAFAVRTGRIGDGGDNDTPTASASISGGVASEQGGGNGSGAPSTEPRAERAAATEESAGSGETDPALLTDEDRVTRVLREEGGRMKQSDVVDALGWSKSKTSRVLSRMADAGEVEKLRIGRENVIDVVDDDEA
ncbi:helix-turn-helix transcriptional regulator [Halorubrum yunnanense]|uniref:Helix-turn-helix transcriptional regulator n=1 Tax=Halorubrum yunnanense TaxID=1526162 RepID=A0ABD5YBP3_9EURY|nr:helix-turn-helix domain-containing protein [Halorubrum yunnanense]